MCVSVCERERVGEMESVCVCVCVRERVRGREGESRSMPGAQRTSEQLINTTDQSEIPCSRELQGKEAAACQGLGWRVKCCDSR